MHSRFHELGGNMFKWNEQGVDESPPAAVNPCHFVLPKLRHYLQNLYCGFSWKVALQLVDNVCQWKLGKMQEIMTAIKQVRGWAKRRQKRGAQVLIHSLLNLSHFHILTSIFFHLHSQYCWCCFIQVRLFCGTTQNVSILKRFKISSWFSVLVKIEAPSLLSIIKKCILFSFGSTSLVGVLYQRMPKHWGLSENLCVFTFGICCINFVLVWFVPFLYKVTA